MGGRRRDRSRFRREGSATYKGGDEAAEGGDWRYRVVQEFRAHDFHCTSQAAIAAASKGAFGGGWRADGTPTANPQAAVM